MKYVGAHVSAAGGVENAPLNAIKIGAKAFALFTKNQKRWVSKPFSEDNIAQFKKNMTTAGIKPEHVLPHDSYLINLGHPEKEKRDKSLTAFIDEITRVDQLGLKYLNFHPGSHLRQISEEESMDLIAESLNKAIAETEKVVLVIENTAGQGSNLGYKFEHLAYIIERIEDKSRIGICIDTCHVFAAGYDISTPESFDKVMDEFDRIVGIKYLKAMHINDSKVELGKRVDRHHSIGKGVLGIEPFKFIMNDKRFEEIPLILETIEPGLWEEEIKLLYSFTNPA